MKCAAYFRHIRPAPLARNWRTFLPPMSTRLEAMVDRGLSLQPALLDDEAPSTLATSRPARRGSRMNCGSLMMIAALLRIVLIAALEGWYLCRRGRDNDWNAFFTSTW